ncbi:MAG: cyclic nucleotide-binding domain-containing protein [Bellilinea sp.]
MQVDRSEVLDILRQCHIFHRLTDEQLESVTDRVEAFLYEAKQIIFEQGSVADGFFFVVSGRVRLERTRKKAADYAVLESRDYFGDEALAKKPVHRRTTATALSEVIVLRLTPAGLSALRQEFPEIALPMRVVLNSYLLSMDLKMDWRAPREVVHFIARRHWLFLILKLLPALAVEALFIGVLVYLAIVVLPDSSLPVILLGLTLFGLLVWLGWLVLDWANDYAVVTNRRVVKLEKVLLVYESRQEVPLDAVLADDLKTDQIGRLMDYGNILVRTYTGVIVLNRLAHPQQVINLINEVRGRKKFHRRSEQLDQIDRTIRERIEHLPGDKAMPAPVDVPLHVKAGALQEWMSQLFLLRLEEDGNIIYRTHWFLLLKKIGLPLFLSFILLIGVFLIWLNIIPFGASTGTLLFLILGPALFLWLVYQYVDWRNDRYIITPELIMDVFKKPLGTEEKKSAPLRNILSIDYERKNLIALIFNFGTVYIRVGESTFTFDNVVNPAEVQRELFQSFMELKQRDEVRLEQERHDQMADWIERYHNYIGGATSENPLDEIPEDEGPVEDDQPEGSEQTP